MSIWKSVNRVFGDKDDDSASKQSRVEEEQVYTNQEPTVAPFLEQLGAPNFEDCHKSACIFVEGRHAKPVLITEDSLDVSMFEGKSIANVVGCFCPPHRGHYEMVSYVAKHADFVMLSSVNYSTNSRHGTPLEHTIATWIDWCRTIPQTKFFIFWTVFASWLERSIPSSIKAVYMYVSIEDEAQREQQVDDAQKYHFSQYKNVSEEKRKLLVRSRPESVSATKFVEALKDESTSVDECVINFVPANIGVEAGRRYVKHIRDTYGDDLSVEKRLAAHLLLLLH